MDNENKTEKKKISKKNLIIICSSVAVIIIAAVICIFVFNNDGKGDASGDASGDAGAKTTEAQDSDPDEESNEVIYDTKANGETNDKSSSTEPTSTDASNPGSSEAENEQDIISSDDELDDIDVIENDYEIPKEVTIVEKTTEKNKWPSDKIPDSVPACKYVSLDRCTSQDDGNQQVWFMSWVSKISDYENWIKAIKNSGFTESARYPGKYANGTVIIDTYTEEDTDPANYWVSVELYTSTPIDYKAAPLNGVFPEFDKGDSTLEYWVAREDSGKYIAQYAGSQNWDALVEAYKVTLQQNGFTIENDYASKTVNGVFYSVYFKGAEVTSDEMIVYLY